MVETARFDHLSILHLRMDSNFVIRASSLRSSQVW